MPENSVNVPDKTLTDEGKLQRLKSDTPLACPSNTAEGPRVTLGARARLRQPEPNVWSSSPDKAAYPPL